MTCDPGYFSNNREDVAELVEKSAKTVLDVGCGKGMLGSLLKSADNGRTVVGIEKFPDAAGEARHLLDKVISADLESPEFPVIEEKFDCIIFADILEHLRDPLDILKKFRNNLNRNGFIVCSIPNVRHYTIFLQLLLKGWEYKEFGILDKTHLRFFSRSSMIKLLDDAGYNIEVAKPRIVASKKARIANAVLMNGLEEFLAMQYLFRARAR